VVLQKGLQLRGVAVNPVPAEHPPMPL
jgi:hypothetical protein